MNAGLLLYLSYGGGRAPHLVHLYPTLVDQEAAELLSSGLNSSLGEESGRNAVHQQRLAGPQPPPGGGGGGGGGLLGQRTCTKKCREVKRPDSLGLRR